MSALSKTFARNLRECLAKAGLNQSDLARKLGVKPPTLAGTLTGKTPPGLDRMEKISRILGVSVAALLAEDGAPEPRIERPTIAAALRQDIEAIAQKAASEAATLAIQKFRESQAVDVPIAKLIELLRARPDALEIALRSAEAYVAGQSVASEAKPKDQSG